MTTAMSLSVLVIIFAIATATSINMGLLAFLAVFLVAWAAGFPISEVTSTFPGGIFITVVGITLLSGVARANGTIELVVTRLVAIVRGRRWAVVWLMFMLGAVLMAMGNLFAVGMLAPVAMPIARRERIDPLLMGMMIGHGVLGAAFSPITLYGAFVNGWMAEAGLPKNPLALFLIPFGLSLLMATVLFLVKGRELLRDERSHSALGETNDTEVRGSGGGSARPAASTVVIAAPDRRTTLVRAATLAGMLGLVVGTTVWQVDVGVAALVISVLLLLIAPSRHKEAINHISWSATLIVCGMLTYMELLESNGTIEWLSDAAASLGSPLVTAFLLCLAVAVISAVGSSLGTLGIVLPLTAPLLAQGELNVIGFVAAVVFCTVVVDVSPFSGNGVMILANAESDDPQMFQDRILRYCLMVVVSGPVLAFVAVVLPTSI